MRPVLTLALRGAARRLRPARLLPDAAAGRAAARAVASVGSVAVADISLPAYAEAIEIAVLDRDRRGRRSPRTRSGPTRRAAR